MSVNTVQKRVLIVGGYGLAGRQTAALLATRLALTGLSVQITIAGRHLEKAEACVRELRLEQASEAVHFHALVLDLTSLPDLERALQGQDLLLLCLPLPEGLAEPLLELVLASSAHYLDLVPGGDKFQCFQRHRAKIQKRGKCLVLEAGVDPGLPAWLARYAVAQMAERYGQATHKVTLFARYRDGLMGCAGIQDMLESALLPARVYRRGWQRAPFWQFVRPLYPGGLGRALSVPLFLQELERLPERLKLQELALFHAGINPVTNALVFAYKLGLRHLVTASQIVDWLAGAIQRFTPQPGGIAFRVEAEGPGAPLTMELWHEHPYRATSAVAAWVAAALLSPQPGPVGCWFMGEWLELDAFQSALTTDLGFSWALHEKA